MSYYLYVKQERVPQTGGQFVGIGEKLLLLKSDDQPTAKALAEAMIDQLDDSIPLTEAKLLVLAEDLDTTVSTVRTSKVQAREKALLATLQAKYPAPE